MRRINTQTLASEDFTYIKDFQLFAEEHKRWEEGVREEAREEGREEPLPESVKISKALFQ